MKSLQDFIRTVPDFPRNGVVFRDISPLLRHHFCDSINAMAELYTSREWDNIDVIAGIESRGLIFASALAHQKQKGLVLIRKQGKMPAIAARTSYELEYGAATLEIQAGEGRCLIVDDVLATGGTFTAAAELCNKVGYELRGFATLINLSTLNTFRWKHLLPRAVLTY